MEDAAIKVTKKGSIYIATCKVSGIETYSKDELRAIEDCRQKSIERFSLWQRELTNSLILSDLPTEGFELKDEIIEQEKPYDSLVARLEKETDAGVASIEGLPDFYITSNKEVFRYLTETDSFQKLNLIERTNSQGYVNLYFSHNGKKYFLLKIFKNAFKNAFKKVHS